MKQIKGRFEVKATPLETDAILSELGLMRMKFEKKFFGALKADGIVAMMGIMDKTIGSGAYVAIERITGEVESKIGTFLLQHSSSMEKRATTQSILVIPDSGTGELSGISGNMVVDIQDGQHFYTFNYEFKR